MIGYNLSGDYESNLPETHLTSTAIDCSDLSGVTLHFRRWLNVEQPRYDHAYLRASNDGISWTTIWENGAEIVDTAWTPQVFDLSGLADGRPGLYLRWTMGTTDASWRYSGWNIDDVEIWAESTVPPPNHTPVADDLAVSTEEDHSLNLSLSASDQDGDALSYVIVTPPAYGMLTGTAPDLVYAPLQDFYGSDGFTYRANDGQADSNTAVVSITVIPVNDAPIAASQVVTTAQDAELHITLTASDVDGDPLTFSVIDEPDHGALSGSGQELTYRPNPDYFGPDSFAFRAHDGLAESNTAAVGITVLSGKPKLMLPIVLCSMR